MTVKSHKKPFEPMLAAPRGEIDGASFPLYIQPKLDGIRFVVRDGILLSRKLELIPNKFISKVLSDPMFNGMDGELVHGDHDRDVYHRTESIVMSENKNPEGLIAWVFDDFTFPTSPYRVRYDSVLNRFGRYSIIKPIPCTEVDNIDELMQADQEHHDMGYEGSIVRDPLGMYKYGRSTETEASLWKIKRFIDDEMLVHDVLELNHNDNEATTSNTGKTKRSHRKEGKRASGVLGVLVGTSPKWPGEIIKVGSSNLPRVPLEEARAMFVGQLVTFKHQPSGAKDKPRFPVYKGIRHRMDVDFNG